ncbi:hypothetical protein GH714_037453 [Hevea brasiliensis]|uniref:Uncharacterized protein n=1 Tax=Hevea brasiliensis TaxID=3981 RepID=A0A6A6MRR4_HEVBR|nr:hypothetical protein GH714_037453 [Hevea brasiliensis]
MEGEHCVQGTDCYAATFGTREEVVCLTSLSPDPGGLLRFRFVGMDITGVILALTGAALVQDGHDSEDPKQSTADMTAFVQNLLQQMQSRFQTMSDSIVTKNILNICYELST